MKKIVKTTIVLLFSAFTLSAMEWGGKISDNTSFSDNSPASLKLKQINTAAFWLSVPMNKKNTDYFSTEAQYKFKYDKTDSADKTVENILDLNLLKFSINRNINGKTLSFNVGRYFIADNTLIIFSQPSDGIMAKYEDSNFSVSAYAGFTGLLNSKNVSIINSPVTKYKENADSPYSLAAKYIPFGAAFTMPNVFANQQLNVQTWGFADLNGDEFSRFYISAGLDGYLLKNLSYNFVTALGTKNFENVSNLSKLYFRFYPMKFLAVNAGAVYASGKHAGLSPFTGFTSQTADLSSTDAQYSAMTKFDAGAGLSLFNKAYISTNAALVLSVPEEKLHYKGIQYRADCMWNIFDDVQVGTSFSQFFGKANADNKTSISFNAALVF